MPDKHRVFFALWPGEEVALQFDEAGRRAHAAFGGRHMRCETLHLTLAFVGSVAPASLGSLHDMAGAIRRQSFALTFDRLQCLRRKKIAWAAADAPQGLLDLVSALEAGLKTAGFRTEARPFAAHVTLLRHVRCEAPPPEEALHIGWPVLDFVLAESELKPEGASYRILQRWELGQT